MADLADVLGTQESATLEFERQIDHLGTVRTVVTALANDLTGAGSGDLLIGVDKTGEPSPVDTDTSDETLLRYLSVRDDGKVLPLPALVVTAATYRGRPVVRVHVEAADLPPVRCEGVVWVRPGPQTVAASGKDERVLLERRSTAHLPFDSHGLPGTSVGLLDQALLESTFIPAAVAPEVLEGS